MSHFLAQLQARPASTALLGSVSGWASVEFLRGAQIVAALLAIAVSLCALILTAPKAVAQVRRWVARRKLSANTRKYEQNPEALERISRCPACPTRGHERDSAEVD